MRTVQASGIYPKSRRALGNLMWLTLAAFAVATVVTPHHGFVVWRDGALSWSTQALPAMYCWVALAQNRGYPRRLECLLMASAITAFAAGDAVMLWLLSANQQPPVPSPADFGYLLFYPLAAAAVVVAGRRQRLLRDRAAWLDTVIGALAGASIVATALGEQLRVPRGGTAGAVITALFPMFDVGFLALIAAVAVVQAFRLPSSWVALSLGFLVFTAADVIYAHIIAAGHYTVGSVLDPTWSLGLALMAVWCTASPVRLVRRAKEPADLVVPLAAVAVGCTALLSNATGWDLPPVALALAVGAILSTATKSVSSRMTGLEKVHELTLQRSQLLDRLVDAQEQERARVAADVHDEPVQALAAINLRLGLLRRKADRLAPELAAEVDQLQRLADEASTALRGVLVELEPVSEGQDLTSILNDTLTSMFEGTSTRWALDIEALPPLHPQELTQASRIVTEALRNVRQHAHATQVAIHARALDGGVEVTVTDDGVGVSPQTWSSPPGHRGIATMRDRAELAGGWCRLEPVVGASSGTVVRFWMPTPDLPSNEPGTSQLVVAQSVRRQQA